MADTPAQITRRQLIELMARQLDPFWFDEGWTLTTESLRTVNQDSARDRARRLLKLIEGQGLKIVRADTHASTAGPIATHPPS